MDQKTAGLASLEALSEKQVAIYTAESTRRQRSTGVAYLLFFLLGGLGVHQFYLGRTLRGMGFLVGSLLGWTFLFAGIGSAMAGADEKAIEAAAGTMVVGWLAFAGVGFLALWDLFTLPRQVARRDERMRAELVAELAAG